MERYALFLSNAILFNFNDASFTKCSYKEVPEFFLYQEVKCRMIKGKT